jgi:FkbM family methyltransferase
VRSIFYKFSGLFYKLHRFFFTRAKTMERGSQPLSEINKEKWYADNREKELRYRYDLDENSVVLDVGGYEGDFAAEIYARYKCKVFVFEPVKRFVDVLNHRFKKNNDIVIYSKGLGAKEETISIHVMDEASSYNRSGSNHKTGAKENIDLTDVKIFFEKENLSKVDLVKINIEGAEYDLLDRMIELKYIPKCANFQVQFHDFYPDFDKRYKRIKDELEKTHALTYSYPYVWENWKLK